MSGPRVFTFPRLLSDEECDVVVRAGEREGLRPATIRVGAEHRERVVDPGFRSVDTCDLAPLGELAWLGERLLACAYRANDAYRFDLAGALTEAIVFLRYGPGGHYRAHTDANTGVISGRRLSIIVQLSEPGCYEGGTVEIFAAATVAAQERGAATVFPSDLLHQVHPLRTGVRHALVAWVHGR